MKAHREAAEKAMSAKLKRLGAQGDKKFAMHDRKAYATGGMVSGGQDAPGGGPVGGGPSKPNLSKPSRAGVKGKKSKGAGKGKTNVNVIVMSGAPGPEMGPKPPMPPMPPGGPGGGLPPMPMMPPKPPMGAGPGGPPMPPMRKYGGRVKMAGASKPVGKGKRGC